MKIKIICELKNEDLIQNANYNLQNLISYLVITAYMLLFQVMLSMMEIYNEQVRDLLNAKTMTIKGGLKVRQHPTKGFYGMSTLLSVEQNSSSV